MLNSEDPRNKIFIQIASYRDPELIPTIDNCIENADHPENLVFSISHQFDEQDKWDTLDKYKNDPRFKIIEISYLKSKGACWARNLLQQQYDGEKYTLQLDSHHRFAKGWDTELISEIEQLQAMGVQKPLLTTYAPSFNPEKDPQERAAKPWKMNFDRFIPEGAVFFLPGDIPNWELMTHPIPARFYSAHLCFTLGSFCTEVQHNPNYYFHGEEISIAVRAYTWGYDLFHPHKVVIWHEYTRKGRAKHWDDHTVEKTGENWNTNNADCHRLNRKLFGMDGESSEGLDPKYGFGPHRTLKQYEEYAGIMFSKRGVQQETLANINPPNPSIFSCGGEKAWEAKFVPIFKHCIDIGFDLLPEEDYTLFCIAFEDKNGEIPGSRIDATKDEIDRLRQDPDKYFKIFRSFEYKGIPEKWVVWPFSASKGWCTRLQGFINK